MPNIITVSADDQVKAYIKKIMSQLKEWMQGGKISKLVVVITSKETGEHVERWQFDVCTRQPSPRYYLNLQVADCRCDRLRYLASSRRARAPGKLVTRKTMPRGKCSNPRVDHDHPTNILPPCRVEMPSPNLPNLSRRQKSKFKRKSKPSSARSPPLLPSSPFLTGTAPLMCLSMPMPTQTFPWNGATAMPKKLRTQRKSN